MRRLILAAAGAALACASPGLPPGGPPDEAPPGIVRIRPDSNAVNVRSGSIVFALDEVVSQRPQGRQGLADLFLISPSAGEPSVSWRRSSVGVTPQGGLRPGTTYTVTMLPGLTDLSGNSDSVGVRIVFSTGPEIAEGAFRGIVFDWLVEKPAPLALVEAIPLPASRDSLRYFAIADSAGRFALEHVPPGNYLLRATVDANKNRLLDPREAYDSVTVALSDTLRREMLAFVRDTIGPGIQTLAVTDSLTLRVQLDRALDTAQVIAPSLFSLKRADSTVVPIVAMTSVRDFERARDDSVRRVDSLRTDSTRRAAEARADSLARAPAAPTPPRPGAQRANVPRTVSQPPRDTTPAEPAPVPSVRPPVSEFILRLGEPLAPATSYRLATAELRTLLGHVRSSERVFSTPRPPPVADSAQRDSARRDTTAKRDTSAARDSVPPDTTARDSVTPDPPARLSVPRARAHAGLRDGAAAWHRRPRRFPP